MLPWTTLDCAPWALQALDACFEAVSCRLHGERDDHVALVLVQHFIIHRRIENTGQPQQVCAPVAPGERVACQAQEGVGGEAIHKRVVQDGGAKGVDLRSGAGGQLLDRQARGFSHPVGGLAVDLQFVRKMVDQCGKRALPRLAHRKSVHEDVLTVVAFEDRHFFKLQVRAPFNVDFIRDGHFFKRSSFAF